MHRLRAIAGALASVVAVLFGAAILGFFALRVIPGDAVDAILGPLAQVSDETRAQLRRGLGLDEPLPVQFITYLRDLLSGDLGQSYQLGLPVAEVIGRQLGSTVELAGTALALAIIFAGLSVVFIRRGPLRSATEVFELVVLSSPVFWIGLILLSVFTFGLGWFNFSARSPSAIVLPAVTLALPVGALLAQVLRDGVDYAEREPFADTVRARGAGPVWLTVRHSLRHGASGGITLAAYLTGSLLGGAVLVETVFARAGIGRVALAAIRDRDLPVVTGLIILSALLFVVINLLVDLLSPVLDPRLRGGSPERVQ